MNFINIMLNLKVKFQENIDNMIPLFESSELFKLNNVSSWGRGDMNKYVKES